MKQLLTLTIAIGLTAGAAVAGCGKKVTDSGTLQSYDPAKKTVVVMADGKETTLTVTPTTENREKLEKMVGKKVIAVSEHAKLDSVKPAGD